jgi:hypothetical protein
MTLEEVLAAGLTLTMDEVLEEIKRQPGFVSGEVFPTPDFITDQLTTIVNNETVIDRNTSSIKMVFQKENENPKTLIVVVNNDFLKQWPSFSFWKDLPGAKGIGAGFASGIIYCDCENGCDNNEIGTYHNKLQNMGDPPTFYLDPTTSLNRRIYSHETEPLPALTILTKLKEKVEQLPDVEKVLIERSRVSEIDDMYPDDVSVVITPIMKKAPYMLENFPEWKNHLSTISYFGLKSFEELEVMDLPNETFDNIFNKIEAEIEASIAQAHEFFANN